MRVRGRGSWCGPGGSARAIDGCGGRWCGRASSAGDRWGVAAVRVRCVVAVLRLVRVIRRSGEAASSSGRLCGAIRRFLYRIMLQALTGSGRRHHRSRELRDRGLGVAVSQYRRCRPRRSVPPVSSEHDQHFYEFCLTETALSPSITRTRRYRVEAAYPRQMADRTSRRSARRAEGRRARRAAVAPAGRCSGFRAVRRRSRARS
jgi:hypothetical protein